MSAATMAAAAPMKPPRRWKGEPPTVPRESSPVTSPDPSAVWRAGWHRGHRHCASPNFGPRPPSTAVELAIVHSISLPPGRYGGDAIERLFTNRLDWDAHPYFGQIRGLEV